MPRPLTETQKATAASMLLRGERQQVIAEAVPCHIQQVKRMKKNMETWGTVIAPKLGPQGRPRILNQKNVDVSSNSLFDMCSFRLTLAQDLREFLSKKPFAYRDEMQSFLFDEYDIQVSLTTLSRELKNARISRKKVFSIIFTILKFVDYSFNAWLYSEMQT